MRPQAPRAQGEGTAAAVIGATRLRLERLGQPGNVGGFGYAEGDTHRQRLADGSTEHSGR